MVVFDVVITGASSALVVLVVVAFSAAALSALALASAAFAACAFSAAALASSGPETFVGLIPASSLIEETLLPTAVSTLLTVVFLPVLAPRSTASSSLFLI